MTITEIYSTLEPLIVRDDTDDFIKTGKSTYVSVDDFFDMFKKSELTLSSLRNNDRTTERWLSIFLNWKQKGILN